MQALGISFFWPRPLAVTEGGVAALGHSLSLLWVAPFVLMLLSVAVFPLVSGHWWEKNLASWFLYSSY